MVGEFLRPMKRTGYQGVGTLGKIEETHRLIGFLDENDCSGLPC